MACNLNNKASNGNDSILYNEILHDIGNADEANRYYNLTFTENFKKWFGNGYKDENGEPKVIRVTNGPLLYRNEKGQYKSVTNKGSFGRQIKPIEVINYLQKEGKVSKRVHDNKHWVKKGLTTDGVNELESNINSIDRFNEHYVREYNAPLVFVYRKQSSAVIEVNEMLLSVLNNRNANKIDYANVSDVEEFDILFEQLHAPQKQGNVKYAIKAVPLLQSDKARTIFDKGVKNNWTLDKVLNEIGGFAKYKDLFNKEDLVANVKTLNLDKLALDIASDYTYAIDMNITKDKIGSLDAIGGLYVRNYPNNKIGDILVIGGREYKIIGTTKVNDPNDWGDGLPKINRFIVVHKERNNSDYYKPLSAKSKEDDVKYKNDPNWEYNEVEIATPFIKPKIKGHAQFSTENGIGWVRLWKNESTGELEVQELQSDLFQKGRKLTSLIEKTSDIKSRSGYNRMMGGEVELVSFEFNNDVYESTVEDVFYSEENQYETTTVYYKNGQPISSREFNKAKEDVIDLESSALSISSIIVEADNKKDKLINLLSRDNNWETFFVNAIVQYASNNGFGIVRFPKGGTAAKIEGHQTLEELKKQKEARIKKLESIIIKRNPLEQEFKDNDDVYINYHAFQSSYNYVRIRQNFWNRDYKKDDTRTLTGDNYDGYVIQEYTNGEPDKITKITKERALELIKKSDEGAYNESSSRYTRELTTLKRELKDIEEGGFAKLNKVAYFYETTITNILRKQGYNPQEYIDEYNNEWNEVFVTSDVLNDILLAKVSDIAFEDIEGKAITINTNIMSRLTNDELLYGVNVASSILFQSANYFKKLTLRKALEGITVKKMIAGWFRDKSASELQKYIGGQTTRVFTEQNHAVNLKIADEILRDDSMLWEKIKLEAKLNSGITITELNDIDIDIDPNDVSNTYDENTQFSISPDKRISSEVKDIINNTNDLENTIPSVGGLAVKLRAINVIPHLVQNLYDSKSVMDMLDKFQKLIDTNHSYQSIYDQLMNDPNKAALFFTNFKSSALQRVSVTISTKSDINEAINIVVKNKSSFIQYQLANVWKNTIISNKLSGLYDTLGVIEKIKAEYETYTEAIGNAKVTSLLNLFKHLNIDINERAILGYLNNPDNLKGINPEAYSEAGKKYANSSNPQQDYITTTVIGRLADNLINTIYKYVTGTSEELSSDKNLLRIAKKLNHYFVPTTLAYTNIEGNIEQTFNKPTFLSDWFDTMRDDVKFLNKLKSMARDRKLRHSNWLFNTPEHSGFLNLPSGVTIRNLTDAHIDKLTLNKEFYYDAASDTYKFDGYFNEGLSHTGNNKNLRYQNIDPTDWAFVNIMSYIKGNNFTKEDADEVGTKSDKGYAMYTSLSPADRGNSMFLSAPRIVILENELTDLSRTKQVVLSHNSKMFEAIMRVLRSELTRMDIARNHIYKIDGNNNRSYNPIESLILNYHYKKTIDGKGKVKYTFSENGKLVGDAFKFHNFVFIDKYGTEFRLDDIFKDTPTTDILKDPAVMAKVYSFMDRMITNIITTEKAKLRKNKSQIDRISKNNFNSIVAEYALNRFVTNHEMTNFFLGDVAFYGNSKAANKRVTQLLASGMVNSSYGTTSHFYGVTINDVLVTSNIINNIKHTLERQGVNKEMINIVLEPYKKINATDGISYITLEEYAQRLQLFGQYKRYEGLIDNLKDDNATIDYNTLNEFIQSQKNFYYGYDYDSSLGIMVPTQVKNSEVVLIPRFIKGTQLEAIYDAMTSNNIGQVNFESSEKVGTKYVAHVSHDGNILVNELNNEFIKGRKRYYYNNLRKQQDIQNHIIDSENKHGVQIAKKMLDNVDDPAIVREIFDLFVANIEDSSSELLNELGITRTEDGYNVDINKISKVLLEEYIKRSLNVNYIYGVTVDENTQTFKLPLDSNTTRKKNESIINALFSNNVVTQRHPGIHGPQVSNAFMRELASKTGITNIKNLPTSKDLKHQTFINKDGKDIFIKAQVLLPQWSKRFFSNKANITLEDLKAAGLDTMLGYRIPTEGKQSVFVFEIVGFLDPAQGSSIVIPHDFIAQTGADFDIDTIYTMQYNFKMVNNKPIKVKYHTNVEEAYEDRYGKTRAFLAHLDNLIAKDFERANKEEYSPLANTMLNQFFELHLPDQYTDMEVDEILKENNFSLELYKKLEEKIATFPKKEDFLAITDPTKFNSKEARENKLLDLYVDIMSNPKYYFEISMSNDFTDTNNSKLFAQAFYDKTSNVINFITPDAQDLFRQTALAGRMLKGISVNGDSFVSIAQRIGLIIKPDKAVKIKFNIKKTIEVEVDGKKIKSKKYTLKKLREHFGAENVTKDGVVTLNIIGNNYNGTFTNIDGHLITRYVAQATAHILDNVKHELPYGVTDNTINEWRLIPSIGGNWLTSTLLVNQAAITIFNEKLNSANQVSSTSYGNPNWAAKSELLTQLFGVFVKMNNPILDSIPVAPETLNAAKAKINKNSLAYIDYNILASLDKLIDKDIIISDEYLIDMLNKRKNYIKLSDELKADYLIEQLAILKYYKNLTDIGASITKFQRLTSFDKARVGPEFSAIAEIQDLFEEAKAGDDYLMLNNGNNYIDAIYNGDVYTPLKAYKEHGIDIAYQAFNEFFITQSNAIRYLLRYYPTEVHKTVLDYVIAYNLQDLKFFNDTDVNRLFGISSTKLDKTLDISQATPENIKKFEQLSAIDKLMLIKEKYKEYISANNVLTYLHPIYSPSYIEKVGHPGIEFITDRNENDFINSFSNLWYNENPYVHMLAQDLVRYAYFANGMTFGMNMSKIIPANILFNEAEDLTDINGNRVSTFDVPLKKGIGYTSHLAKKRLLHFEDRFMSPYEITFKINLARANWESNILVPRVKLEKRINPETGVAELSSNEIDWNNRDKNGVVTVDERNFKRLSPTVRKANVVKFYSQASNGTIKVELFAKLSAIGGIYYYVPVGKLNKFEFDSKSRVETNNTFPMSLDEYISKYLTSETDDTVENDNDEITDKATVQVIENINKLKQLHNKGVGVYTLRVKKEDNLQYLNHAYHLGNPFSHLYESATLFKTPSIEQAVAAYEAWLMGVQLPLSHYGIKPRKVNIKTFVNHSGGAVGADSAFDKIGKSFGQSTHIHYYYEMQTPLGNKPLTREQYMEGLAEVKKAAVKLGKKPFKPTTLYKLARNWMQVKNSSQVVAIVGLNDNMITALGGTGWAVEMAKIHNKEVNVFNIRDNKWYTWNGNQFELSDTPILHPNFAGIGSQQFNDKRISAMTPESIQAIKDVYQKTINTEMHLQQVEGARRLWIRKNMPNLKGKTLLYWASGFRSHAHALADLVNGDIPKVEGTKPNKPEQLKLFANVSDVSDDFLEYNRARIDYVKSIISDYNIRVQQGIKNKTLETTTTSLNELKWGDNYEAALASAFRINLDYVHTTLKQMESMLNSPNSYTNPEVLKAVMRDEAKRIEFTRFMHYMNIFIKGFAKIENLQPVAKDELSQNETKMNDYINKLISYSGRINTLQSTYKSLSKTYFNLLLTPISTNPDIKLGIRNIFDKQEDESKVQLLMDSLLDTHHSFLANFMKHFYVTRESYFRERKETIEKYFKELERLRAEGYTIDQILDEDNKLIQEFDESYKTDWDNLRNNVYEAELKYGKYSPEYYRAERTYKKWILDNILSDNVHEVELAKFEANDILFRHPEARELLDRLSEATRSILSNYDGINDYSQITEDDIQRLAAIKREEGQLKQFFDEKGVKKEGKDLEIATVLNDYSNARGEILSKYFTPVIKSEIYKNKLEEYKKLDTDEAREWLLRNTKIKNKDIFWTEFKFHSDILGKKETDTLLKSLSPYKDKDGVVNGNLVSDELKARIKKRNESRFEETETTHTPKAVKKPKQNEFYTDSYYDQYENKGVDSREDDSTIKDLTEEFNAILEVYIDSNGKVDTTSISIEDLERLIELNTLLAFNRALPYTVDDVRFQFNKWFGDTHETVTDTEAFEEARKKAESRGKKYYNRWLSFNTQLEYEQEYFKNLENLRTQFGLTSSELKEEHDLGGVNLDALRKIYNVDSFTALPNEIKEEIMNMGKFLYEGDILGDPLYTLADFMKLHNVKADKVQFNNIEEAQSVLRQIYKDRIELEKTKRVKSIHYADAKDAMHTLETTTKYKNRLAKYGVDSEWYYNNHYLNHRGEIKPVPYWTISRPKDKGLYSEDAPTRKIWAYSKVKEKKYIDKQKSNSLKWMNENVHYIQTPYYTETKARMDADLESGAITQDEFIKWYHENHFYNPYTHNYEPISAWTTMVPSDEYIDEYAPLDSMIEYEVKQQYANNVEDITNYNKRVDAYNEENDTAVLHKEVPTDPYRSINNRALPKKSSKYYYDNRDNKHSKYRTYDEVKANPLYSYLTNLLKEATAHYGRETIIDEQQLPIMPKHNSDNAADFVKGMFKKMGWYSYPSKEVVGENNESMRILNLAFLNPLTERERVEIPKEVNFGSRAEYLEAYLAAKKENAEIDSHNREFNKAKMDNNWEKVIEKFLIAANVNKFTREMEHEMRMALEEIRNLDLSKRRSLMHRLRNITREKLGKEQPELFEGDDTTASVKGINSNLEKHFLAFMDMIFYGEFEKDEGTWTKVARVLQNITSAKGMWWNIPGAFNNVAFGKTQIALERFSGYFFDNKDRWYAEKEYGAAMPYLFSEVGKAKSNNFANGIIKYFDIVELQDEMAITNNMQLDKDIKKHLFSTNTLYILHHIGEHYMQNVALLSMLSSNRLVNGKIMSFAEFTLDKQYKALQNSLDSKGKHELDKFIRDNKYNDIYLDGKADLIRDFILQSDTGVQSKFLEELKQIKVEAKAEFNQFKQLKDIYELVDGTIKVKDGFNIPNDQESLFKLKVIKVNQKIHGIYNKMDAGTMQRTAIGRLVVQFKKWMRPGFTKRFGSKTGKTFWNEARNEYDTGMYVSAFRFLTKPISDAIANSKEGTIAQALGNIFNDYAKYIGNIGLYWHTLNDTDKANIRRTGVEMLYFAMVAAFLWMLQGIADDDDDDKMWAYSLYATDRLKTEILAFNPLYGFTNETRKLMRDPFAAMAIIEDTSKLLYTAMFETDKEYKGGIYHGQKKLEVQIKKNIPLLNRYLRYENIQNYAGYYKLY
jgi:hypothetical protein